MVSTTQALRQAPQTSLLVLLRISAAVAVIFSLRSLMAFYGENMRDPYQALIIIACLLALILIPGPPVSDIEKTNRLQRIWNLSLSVGFRWILVCAILLLLGYGTKTSSVYSRKLLFTWFIVTPPLIVVLHYLIDSAITRMMMRTENLRRAVIVGANELGQSLARRVASSRNLAVRIDGFFDDRSADRLENGHGSPGPLLGRLADLPEYLRTHNADVIFIALPIRNIQRVSELLDKLHDSTASIYFIPDIFVFDLIQCRTGDIGGMPVIALCETPFQGSQAIVKKISDYVIASTVLLTLSPLMLVIAAAIRLTTPGSVIFKQRRYGLDGEEIIVYKFRTMTVSEDAGPITQASRDDQRITRLGAFLRRYSLDELPQFINVLQGHMSVVGPRPHAVAHNEQYRGLIKGYMIRHKVNPGITGLAQVHGCRGETKSVEDMQRRVEYDLEYLRDWSLMLDLRIILRKAGLVFRDEMAY